MTVAERPRRPELREPRSFPVPQFDAEVLDAQALAPHLKQLPRVDLVAGLADGRMPVRANCARALGLLGKLGEAEAQQVAVALRDAEVPVRLAVAQALAAVLDPGVVIAALLDATLDASSLVAAAAVESLRSLGPRLVPHVPGMLRKPMDWLSARAEALVQATGAAVVPPVLAALSANDPIQVGNALTVIGGLDDDGIRAALTSLQDDRSPAADAVRLQLGRTLATRKRKNNAQLSEPMVFPIEGFDTDLLPRELLQKHKKQLPRPFLFEALRDGRLAVRVNALDALTVQGPPDAAETQAISVLLKDSSASVRAAAARALQGAADPEAVVLALVPMTADKDAQVRTDVAATVRSFGAAALPVLIGCLRMDPAQADATVLPHLQALDELAREPLTAALVHPHFLVRANALAGLINLGHDALLACQRRILAMASDPATEVQALARQAGGILARYGKPLTLDARVLPLDDFADHLVDDAALKKAGRKIEAVALEALTRDGRAVVRANAWKGLASLGPLEPGLAMAAAVACKDGEADVRREAALALRHCPESVLPQVLPPLVVASRDADKTVAQAARTAIFSLGRKAAPHLVTLFGERDGRMHEPAVALAIALDADALPDIVAALDASLPLVRAHALQALAEIGGKALDDALPKALAALQDSYDPMRLHAVVAIGKMTAAAWKKQPGLRDRLLTLWRQDPSYVVRQAVERLLPRLPPR
jgi:HEAT repeat protein